MEKATIGVNIMRFSPVEGNEEFVKSKEKDFLFKTGIESLLKSEGILHLDERYAVLCKSVRNKDTAPLAQKDIHIHPICFPILPRANDSVGVDSEYWNRHLPGAPEAYLRKEAVFYASGREFVEAAKSRNLPSEVQKKVENYFGKNKKTIQSVISLPLCFELKTEQGIKSYEYVLNIHSEKQIQASQSQIVLFESLMSPFLNALAEKIPFIEEQCAILKNMLKDSTNENDG